MKCISFKSMYGDIWYLDITNCSYCELVKLKNEIQNSNVSSKIDNVLNYRCYESSQSYFDKKKKKKKAKKRISFKERKYLNDQY